MRTKLAVAFAIFAALVVFAPLAQADESHTTVQERVHNGTITEVRNPFLKPFAPTDKAPRRHRFSPYFSGTS